MAEGLQCDAGVGKPGRGEIKKMRKNQEERAKRAVTLRKDLDALQLHIDAIDDFVQEYAYDMDKSVTKLWMNMREHLDPNKPLYLKRD